MLFSTIFIILTISLTNSFSMKKIPEKVLQHGHYNYSKSNISVTGNGRELFFLFKDLDLMNIF